MRLNARYRKIVARGKRSTLADWVGRAAFLLWPVHERLLDRLKASSKLFADETTAPVLDPGRGRTKTGQLWAYVRNDRPWGGADPPGVAYAYAPDRRHGYLADVITRIVNGHPQNRLNDLLPWVYPAMPQFKVVA